MKHVAEGTTDDLKGLLATNGLPNLVPAVEAIEEAYAEGGACRLCIGWVGGWVGGGSCGLK